MGKLIPLLFAGAGTATVSVGGFYLVKGSGVAGEATPLTITQKNPNAQPSQVKPELKFSDLDTFKSKKGHKCSEDIFPDDFTIGDLSNVNQFSNTNPPSSDYFGTSVTTEGGAKSCLIINWEKNTYSGETDKGSGTFTGTGSFLNGTKGFIVTNIAKAEKGMDKLKLIGGAYLLEQKTESGQSTGEVKYLKEVATAKEFDGSAFENKFPKAKANSGAIVGEESYGGFMKDKSDLTKICNATSCTGTENPERKLEEFRWTYDANGSKKISEWSDNLDWGNELYTKNAFDLETSLDKFKGTGAKVGN